MENFSNFYKGKKVFVTGHTGFKGSWLAAWLSQCGAKVKGYALQPECSPNLYEKIENALHIDSVIADVRNSKKLEEEILSFEPDLIFHLAAQALVRRSYEIPSETFDVNVVGTTNLMQSASRLPGKCSIVVITTDKVYHNRETDYHYHEADELGGYDPYSASKAAAEIAVSSFRNSFFNPHIYEKHQKAIASARAGNVIGGGDFSKDRIIPDIVKALQADKPLEVRNKFAVRPWQHVLEPISGYLLLGMRLHQDAVAFSGAYNFGPLPQDHLPVQSLVEIALECWGNGNWVDKSDPTQPHEAGLLKLDVNKALRELGWSPKLDSSTAIQWTIDWYKQQEAILTDFTFQQIKAYQEK